MSWTKLPAIKGSVSCLICGCGAKEHLHADSIVAVGFGSAGYSRDGITLFQEQDSDDFVTVEDVEKIAEADPDHDWRIFKHAPLYDAVYQRQGPMEWVLIEKGEGFA